MPTVLRADGFEFVIYHPPREHGPAHVHVFKAGGQAVIRLSPIAVTRVYRMRDAGVIAAVRLAQAHRSMLLDAWREVHG
jgi:hypothetical protein